MRTNGRAILDNGSTPPLELPGPPDFENIVVAEEEPARLLGAGTVSGHILMQFLSIDHEAQRESLGPSGSRWTRLESINRQGKAVDTVLYKSRARLLRCGVPAVLTLVVLGSRNLYFLRPVEPIRYSACQTSLYLLPEHRFI